MKVDTYPMFKIFSVAYYYSIIFGWMPIHVPKNAKDRKNKSSWCIPGIISSIFFIIILVGSSDMTNRLRQITKFRGNISSSNLTVHDRIQIIAGPIFIHSLTINQLFIIVTFVAMPYHLLELRKTFDLFNYFFNRHGAIIGIEAKMNTIVYKVNMELILLIILNFLLSIASVLGSFNRMRLSFFLRFLISADNVLKKMEAFSICVQFWCVSSTLAKCFKCLNDSLSRLHIRKNQATATPPGLFLVPDPYTSPANMVIFLKHIKNAHVDLCSIIDQVNNVYQVLNLLSIIITLLSLLPHLFVFAITMAFSNFRMTPHISLILWPVQYFMKMLITCRIASIATSEAKRTKTLLKSEIHKNLTAQEKCEIKSFLERINRKKIEFSLCGFSILNDKYFLSVYIRGSSRIFSNNSSIVYDGY
ncbi:uncharacterized protein LOC126896215 isoform X2 [Daktulosphaira vitifoliae]|uniref:uncharacterized protein LOC126896215 isoform X2 n=1 Tax=Daktulosphaira vitifoliae TaxID=58002 RepID=UPI0021A98D74|nr:uncharacterized protein LOC126896215 isoform X2 [Daktulosphaira vitifoliae]